MNDICSSDGRSTSAFLLVNRDSDGSSNGRSTSADLLGVVNDSDGSSKGSRSTSADLLGVVNDSDGSSNGSRSTSADLLGVVNDSDGSSNGSRSTSADLLGVVNDSDGSSNGSRSTSTDLLGVVNDSDGSSNGSRSTSTDLLSVVNDSDGSSNGSRSTSADLLSVVNDSDGSSNGSRSTSAHLLSVVNDSDGSSNGSRSTSTDLLSVVNDSDGSSNGSRSTSADLLSVVNDSDGSSNGSRSTSPDLLSVVNDSDGSSNGSRSTSTDLLSVVNDSDGSSNGSRSTSTDLLSVVNDSDGSSNGSRSTSTDLLVVNDSDGSSNGSRSTSTDLLVVNNSDGSSNGSRSTSTDLLSVVNDSDGSSNGSRSTSTDLLVVNDSDGSSNGSRSTSTDLLSVVNDSDGSSNGSRSTSADLLVVNDSDGSSNGSRSTSTDLLSVVNDSDGSSNGSRSTSTDLLSVVNDSDGFSNGSRSTSADLLVVNDSDGSSNGSRSTSTDLLSVVNDSDGSSNGSRSTSTDLLSVVNDSDGSSNGSRSTSTDLLSVVNDSDGSSNGSRSTSTDLLSVVNDSDGSSNGSRSTSTDLLSVVNDSDGSSNGSRSTSTDLLSVVNDSDGSSNGSRSTSTDLLSVVNDSDGSSNGSRSTSTDLLSVVNDSDGSSNGSRSTSTDLLSVVNDSDGSSNGSRSTSTDLLSVVNDSDGSSNGSRSTSTDLLSVVNDSDGSSNGSRSTSTDLLVMNNSDGSSNGSRSTSTDLLVMNNSDGSSNGSRSTSTDLLVMNNSDGSSNGSRSTSAALLVMNNSDGSSNGSRSTSAALLVMNNSDGSSNGSRSTSAALLVMNNSDGSSNGSRRANADVHMNNDSFSDDSRSISVDSDAVNNSDGSDSGYSSSDYYLDLKTMQDANPKWPHSLRVRNSLVKTTYPSADAGKLLQDLRENPSEDLKKLLQTKTLPDLAHTEKFADLATFLKVNDCDIQLSAVSELEDILMNLPNRENTSVTEQLKQVAQSCESALDHLCDDSPNLLPMTYLCLVTLSALLSRCHPCPTLDQLTALGFSKKQIKKKSGKGRKQMMLKALQGYYEGLEGVIDKASAFQKWNLAEFSEEEQSKRKEGFNRASFCELVVNVFTILNELRHKNWMCATLMTTLRDLYESSDRSGKDKFKDESKAVLDFVLVRGLASLLASTFQEDESEVGEQTNDHIRLITNLIMDIIEKSDPSLQRSLLCEAERHLFHKAKYVQQTFVNKFLAKGWPLNRPAQSYIRNNLQMIGFHGDPATSSNQENTSGCCGWKPFKCTVGQTRAEGFMYIQTATCLASTKLRKCMQEHAGRKEESATLRCNRNLEMLVQLSTQCRHLLQLYSYQILPFPFYLTEEVQQRRLLSYLLDHRNSKLWLDTSTQVHIACDIIEALTFLAHRNIDPRDVTAYNIVVQAGADNRRQSFGKRCSVLTRDDFVVKLTDLGLAHKYRNNEQEIRPVRSQGAVPVRWTSPEALFEGRYSDKNMVYSAGCVMYELWTHGCQPFSSYDENNDTDGILRMMLMQPGSIKLTSQPCIPDAVHDLIKRCTNHEPDKRPTLQDIKKELRHIGANEILDGQDPGPIMSALSSHLIYPPLSKCQKKRRHVPETGIPESIQQLVDAGKTSDLYNNTRKSAWKPSLGTVVTEEELASRDRISIQHEDDRTIVKEVVSSKFLEDVLPSLEANDPEGVTCWSHADGSFRVEPDDGVTVLKREYPASVSFETAARKGDLIRKGDDSDVYSGDSVNPDFLVPFISLARAVHGLHEKGWIIRDLKAENILIDCNDGEVILPRIGRARQLNSQKNYLVDDVDEDNRRWLAPEVLLSHQYGKENDIFMLGTVMWQAFRIRELANSDPLASRKDFAPCANIVKEQVVNFVREGTKLLIPAKCPKWLYQLMMKCRDPERAHRPTAESVLQTLQQHATRCPLYMPFIENPRLRSSQETAADTGEEPAPPVQLRKKKPVSPQHLRRKLDTSLFTGFRGRLTRKKRTPKKRRSTREETYVSGTSPDSEETEEKVVVHSIYSEDDYLLPVSSAQSFVCPEITNAETYTDCFSFDDDGGCGGQDGNTSEQTAMKQIDTAIEQSLSRPREDVNFTNLETDIYKISVESAKTIDSKEEKEVKPPHPSSPDLDVGQQQYIQFPSEEAEHSQKRSSTYGQAWPERNNPSDENISGDACTDPLYGSGLQERLPNGTTQERLPSCTLYEDVEAGEDNRYGINHTVQPKETETEEGKICASRLGRVKTFCKRTIRKLKGKGKKQPRQTHQTEVTTTERNWSVNGRNRSTRALEACPAHHTAYDAETFSEYQEVGTQPTTCTINRTSRDSAAAASFPPSAYNDPRSTGQTGSNLHTDLNAGRGLAFETVRPRTRSTPHRRPVESYINMTSNDRTSCINMTSIDRTVYSNCTPSVQHSSVFCTSAMSNIGHSFQDNQSRHLYENRLADEEHDSELDGSDCGSSLGSFDSIFDDDANDPPYENSTGGACADPLYGNGLPFHRHHGELSPCQPDYCNIPAAQTLPPGCEPAVHCVRSGNEDCDNRHKRFRACDTPASLYLTPVSDFVFDTCRMRKEPEE